jgi:cephalosporin hydroxylase
MMSQEQEFSLARQTQIQQNGADKEFTALSNEWLEYSMRSRYVYHFDWLGRPIIQLPQDMIALQEIIWRTQPDLIIETGIAHGGSLIFSASLLALLDYCNLATESEERTSDLKVESSKRRVLGIDIDIRPHNKKAITNHPLGCIIDTIEGSSIDPSVIQQVCEYAKPFNRIMVVLDSNHTHQHVLNELISYAPLTSAGCYCVVFDTFVEDVPAGVFSDRPWGPGNNPKTAVHEFLQSHVEFQIDRSIQEKLMITAAPDGFLFRAE